jgi:hypothetical protein
MNRPGDELRLTVTHRGEHLGGKAGRQHERLELQNAVQEPEHPQCNLQRPPRDAYAWDGECEVTT